jgi:hypothetical protein
VRPTPHECSQRLHSLKQCGCGTELQKRRDKCADAYEAPFRLKVRDLKRGHGRRGFVPSIELKVQGESGNIERLGSRDFIFDRRKNQRLKSSEPLAFSEPPSRGKCKIDGDGSLLKSVSEWLEIEAKGARKSVGPGHQSSVRENGLDSLHFKLL